MNKPKFTKFVEQVGQTTDFADKELNNSIKSQEIMQVNCSNACIGQFPSLLPVLFGYNYKINALTTNTGSESFAVTPGNGNKNEEIKELWSAEELTVNLVNKTATRIANLKHKLDEQMKTIKILQGNEKYRKCSQLIHEEKNVDNSQSFQDSSMSNKSGKTVKIKEPRKQESSDKRIAKMKASTSTKIAIQKPIASHMKRKRLRRGVSMKHFFYHPLVVDCYASMPEELTKEEFLRQLRLIPTTYLTSHDTK